MGMNLFTKRAFVLLLTTTALFLTSACGDSTSDAKDGEAVDETTTTLASATLGDVKLDATANDTTQTVKVGQKIVVALDVNGGTGYTWPVTTAPDAKVLKQLSQTQARKDPSGDPMIVGAPETITTTFEAVSAGTTKVVFSLVGPGSGRKAEDTFTITVAVTA